MPASLELLIMMPLPLDTTSEDDRSFHSNTSCIIDAPKKLGTVAQEHSSLPKRPKSNKRVVFNSNVRVRKIASYKIFPEGMKESIWYSQDESKQLRKDAIKTVYKMIKHLKLGEDECTRGLEFKEPTKYKRRHRRKRHILHTVLKEQERFFLEEDNNDKPLDEELVAGLYQYAGKSCILEALKIGEFDALDAKLAWE